MKNVQVRATISEEIKTALEDEAKKHGWDLPLFIRVILGEKAKELAAENQQKPTE